MAKKTWNKIKVNEHKEMTIETFKMKHREKKTEKKHTASVNSEKTSNSITYIQLEERAKKIRKVI